MLPGEDEKGGSGCSCGMPSRPPSSGAEDAALPSADGSRADVGRVRHRIEQVSIPAGSFVMGDASGDRNAGDGEVPLHRVDLDAFEIDATAVTNDAFGDFVRSTGYVTEAERFGFSAVFHLALAAPPQDILGQPPGTPWWFGVRGADWLHPGGSGSSIDDKGDHPVVHVSWNDAVAYCAWADRRLPTEAEWEYAARGGLPSARFPWGDDDVDSDGWRANIWQGSFPATNTEEDGFLTTAPVRSFVPNGFGLWQSVGNVWEWVADWYSPSYYSVSERRNPLGPHAGQARTMRGGSYLCHDSYCNRYRNSARAHNTPDSSMGNVGFRTLRSA